MNNIISHLDVFLFFVGIIAIQGGIANVIFHSFDDYFDSYYFFTFKFSHFFASFYSMFIYMTRDNSPFVFMKYYPDNYLVNISFMVVIWFFNLILIGLLAGIAYYKLKRQMAKELLKVYSDQNKRKTYEKLRETPKVSKSMLKRVLALHLENKIVPYLLINTYIQEKKAMKPPETKASQYIFGILKRMSVYELIFSSKFNSRSQCSDFGVGHLRNQYGRLPEVSFVSIHGSTQLHFYSRFHLPCYLSLIHI